MTLVALAREREGNRGFLGDLGVDTSILVSFGFFWFFSFSFFFSFLFFFSSFRFGLWLGLIGRYRVVGSIEIEIPQVSL